MYKPQLLSGTLMLAVAVSAGCNRADTKQDARAAAADVKAVASRAGEKLADGWLTTKVQAQFFADGDIKSRYINVGSRDGVVTLRGFIESEAMRQQALQIAKNTDGVRQINDQLLIGQPPAGGFENAAVATTGADFVEVAEGANPGAGEPVNDEMIASRIQASYFLDSMVKPRTINVASANGVVTLRGQVASDAERARALLLARLTAGVQRVEDSLSVDASLAAGSLPSRPSTATSNLSNAPLSVGSGATPSVLPSAAAAVQPSAAPAAAAPARPTAAAPAPTAPAAVAPADADTSLEGTVKRKLTADAQLKSAQVEVSARDGVVLVQGTVPTAAVKQRVLSTIRSTDGVLQVVDRVTIAARRRN